jgi:hypothetical protein
VIVSLGGAPIYIEQVSNIKKHQELLEPFINNEDFWEPAKKWKSKTLSTHEHKNNHLLPWNDIVPDLNEHFDQYLQVFDPTDQFEVETHPWLNRYSKGDWQEQHNHFAPNILFSMAYIIKSNGEDNFVFSDNPYSWYSHFNAEHLFKKWPGRQYTPEQPDGTVMIFPSTVDHFVMPSKSDQYRISASANFVICQK